MEWDPEARAAIDRAPFFVRRFARRRVEELVQAEGRDRVTLADVRRAKEALGPSPLDGPNPLAPSPAREGGTTVGHPAGPRRPLAEGGAAGGLPLPLGEGRGEGSRQSVESVPESVDSSSPHPNPLPEGEGIPPSPAGAVPRTGEKGDGGLGLSSLTEEQIRLIERLVDEIPGQEARYWSAKSCGGAVGCPLTLVDVRAAWQAVVAGIEASGLSEAQAARLKGPVLSHHRFKAAVAGCPNCCSEPQIKDFALVARALPTLGPGDCIQCGSCEAECEEGAVSIASGTPAFDPSRCVGCGACADVCESEAIVKVVGYDVLVGGRLGRRPRLAETIAEGVTLEEAIGILARCLSLLTSEGLPGERLGALLDRVGWARIGAKAPPAERPFASANP